MKKLFVAIFLSIAVLGCSTDDGDSQCTCTQIIIEYDGPEEDQNNVVSSQRYPIQANCFPSYTRNETINDSGNLVLTVKDCNGTN